MVQAVDVQVLRGRAHDLAEERVGIYRDLVPLDALCVGRLGMPDSVRYGVERRLGLRGDVLPERPSQCDVEYLRAAADGEQWLLGLDDAGDKRAFKAVAHGAYGTAGGKSVFAVEFGIAVVPAGDDEGVECLDHARKRSRAARSRQHNGDAACLLDGVEHGLLGIDGGPVALGRAVLGARRHPDERPVHRPVAKRFFHAPTSSCSMQQCLPSVPRDCNRRVTGWVAMRAEGRYVSELAMPLECWPPTLEARCTFGMLLVLLGGSPRGWDVDCFAWGLGCGWSADHLASSLIALLGRRLFCSNSCFYNKDGRLSGEIVGRPS